MIQKRIIRKRRRDGIIQRYHTGKTIKKKIRRSYGSLVRFNDLSRNPELLKQQLIRLKRLSPNDQVLFKSEDISFPIGGDYTKKKLDDIRKQVMRLESEGLSLKRMYDGGKISKEEYEQFIKPQLDIINDMYESGEINSEERDNLLKSKKISEGAREFLLNKIREKFKLNPSERLLKSDGELALVVLSDKGPDNRISHTHAIKDPLGNILWKQPEISYSSFDNKEVPVQKLQNLLREEAEDKLLQLSYKKQKGVIGGK